jgi:hypothetical protein
VAERFSCPYLGAKVELTRERRMHIERFHPEVLPDHRAWIAETLSCPDLVVRSRRSDRARALARWYHRKGGGRYVVVIVVTDRGARNRNWIVTAYVREDVPGGTTEWQRS